jgi:gliding motility-associated-like protein
MSKIDQHSDPLFNAFKDKLENHEANVPEMDMEMDWSSVQSQITAVPSSSAWSALKALSTKTIGFGIAGVAVIATAIVLIIANTGKEASTKQLENEQIEIVEAQPSDESTMIEPSESEIMVLDNPEDGNGKTSKIGKSENNNQSKAKQDEQMPSTNVFSHAQGKETLPTKTIYCDKDLQQAANVVFSDTFICLGEDLIVSNTNENYKAGILVYVEFPGKSMQLIKNQISHRFYEAGDYIVKIKCSEEDHIIMKQQRIKVFNLPDASFSYEFLEDSRIKFTKHTGNLNQCNWDFGDGQAAYDCSPEHTYTKSGNYQVLLKVLSADGCSSQQLESVTVVRERKNLEIHNFFSPNGDGINDYYFIDIENVEMFQLSIMDRDGTLVFSTKNPKEKWDGRNSSNGRECLPGSYFYVLTFKYTDSNIPEKKTGSIYLRR